MSLKEKTDRLGLLAIKALKKAVKEALNEHQRMNVPAVYMRNGKIVYLMPDGNVVSTPPPFKKKRKEIVIS